MDQIVGPNPKVFKLAEGFKFTEGPIWINKDGGYLLFSDPNANTIYKYIPNGNQDGKLEVFRTPSGYSGADIAEYGQPGSNGLTLDPEGRLTINQHGNHRVVRDEADGRQTVLADSYQAIGALEVDVRTLGADVVTGGTAKYLLGSAGLAFMWLRESLRTQLFPTQTGWFADEAIFAMSIADYSPHATARRFDSGTPPVPSLYPGVAGMELIGEIGVPAIEAHVRGLVDRLLSGLDELGATVLTPRGEREYGPLICVVSTDPNALVAALAAEQIVTSTRDSSLRISLHLYNVADDVDRILAVLRANAPLLA